MEEGFIPSGPREQAESFATLGELFETSEQTGLTREAFDNKAYAERFAIDDVLETARGLGEEGQNPWNATGEPTEAGWALGGNLAKLGIEKRKEEFEAWRTQMAEKHPNVPAFTTPLDELARERTRRDFAEYEDAQRRGDGSTMAFLASTAGSLSAASQDPAQFAVALATMGIGGVAGKGLLALAWNAAKIFTAGATTEAALTYGADLHATEAGVDITTEEYLGRSLGAGLLPAGADVAVRGVSRTIGAKALGKQVLPTASGKGVQYVGKEAAEQIAKNKNLATALNKAESSDPAVAQEGYKEVAEITQSPELQEAIENQARFSALEKQKEEQADGFDPTDVEASDLQNKRHLANNREEPPAGLPLEEAPKAKQPNLSDELDQVPKGRSFQLDGKPVHRKTVNANDATFDANTFRFKSGGDAKGITDHLAGVKKWDEKSAGNVILYEREGVSMAVEGQEKAMELVFADGHQRGNLAQRLLAEGKDVPDLDALVFREADGWTPGDVRAFAAKKNISERIDNPVDAAKVLRERPDVLDDSMALSSTKLQQARQMARLSDEAFDAIVAGRLAPWQAALVGQLVPDKSLHKNIVDELAEMKLTSGEQVRYAINQLSTGPRITEEPIDMFGSTQTPRTLTRERAKIFGHVVAAVRKNSKLFKMLTKETDAVTAAGNVLNRESNQVKKEAAEQTLEVVQRAAMAGGKVSDLLNSNSRRVARGEASAKEAGEEIADELQAIMEKDGLKGLMEAPEMQNVMTRLDDPGDSAALAEAVETYKADMPDLFPPKEAPAAKPKAEAQKGKAEAAKEELSPEVRRRRAMSEITAKLRAKEIPTEDFDEAIKLQQMSEVIKDCKL